MSEDATKREPAEQSAVTLTLDAEGGDTAPQEIVAGALQVASPTLRILLVGRPEVVEPLLAGADRSNIEVMPSATVIHSEDEPAGAVTYPRKRQRIACCTLSLHVSNGNKKQYSYIFS